MSLDLVGPCLPCALSTNGDGYGQLKVNGRHFSAHRLAFTLAYGDPVGAVVRHLCGNPSCVNPFHLAQGGHLENAADRDAHGRTARHERHGNAKLSLQDVFAIRASLAAGEKGRSLAAKYGVSESCVSLIKRGKKWV